MAEVRHVPLFTVAAMLSMYFCYRSEKKVQAVCLFLAAVLNQKFHAAREQGASMIFRVDDMSGMRLDGEETVILLSNLLDNAIHECVKLIFSVKNPVAGKVQVTDGIMLDSNGGMHGVGLMNVKAVVDKYGGDFAVSCDGDKFHTVVIPTDTKVSLHFSCAW